MLHFRPVSFGFDSSTGRLRRSRRDRKISQVMRTDVLWCDVIERCRAAATTSIRHITTLVGAGRIYTATDRSHSADCFNTHGALVLVQPQQAGGASPNVPWPQSRSRQRSVFGRFMPPQTMHGGCYMFTLCLVVSMSAYQSGMSQILK